MEIVKHVFEVLRPGLLMIAVLVLGIVVIVGLRKFLDKRFAGQANKNMKLQLIVLFLSLVVLILVIIVSPVNDNQRGQILGLIGIVLSAAIALSSTTFLGNAMAGLMLRSVKAFKPGDFISIGDSFGRVTERGLFHVEIQTEFRDLITLPNLHLVTNPVKVVRSTGTVVSTEVSLGYNIPRGRIKDALMRAAEKCDLQEPFVHVIQLGDFSVVYRVSGLLTDVKHLLSARSQIRESVMDELHAAGIEIVSPTFMNTRQLSVDDRMIPKVTGDDESATLAATPEDVVFDKAEEAQSVEQLRERFEKLGADIADLEKSLKESKDDRERQGIETRIDHMRKIREAIGARLKAMQEQANRDSE
jgi:small conductance mechanosensitive channel